jgi:hypothetical protein
MHFQARKVAEGSLVFFHFRDDLEKSIQLILRDRKDAVHISQQESLEVQLAWIWHSQTTATQGKIAKAGLSS